MYDTTTLYWNTEEASVWFSKRSSAGYIFRSWPCYALRKQIWTQKQMQTHEITTEYLFTGQTPKPRRLGQTCSDSQESKSLRTRADCSSWQLGLKGKTTLPGITRVWKESFLSQECFPIWECPPHPPVAPNTDYQGWINSRRNKHHLCHPSFLGFFLLKTQF